jgi:hypothetical protein
MRTLPFTFSHSSSTDIPIVISQSHSSTTDISIVLLQSHSSTTDIPIVLLQSHISTTDIPIVTVNREICLPVKAMINPSAKLLFCCFYIKCILVYAV